MLRCGYLLFFRLYASRSLSSVACASLGCVRDLRKCVQLRNLVSPLWVRILERMHDSLLPIYRTTSPSALPISYTPDWRSGKSRISDILKGIHLVLSDIMHPFRTDSLQPCYNIIVGTGGLEPPRQLSADSSQSYRGCLLHHVPSIENQGEGSLPDRPSPESPYLKPYHIYGILSMGKPNKTVANTSHNPIIGVNDGCLS